MPTHSRIPILGIQGVGKTSLAFSLAYYLSDHDLGKVSGDSADHFHRALPFLLKGEPMDATVGNRDFQMTVDDIYCRDFELVAEDAARQKAGCTILEIEELRSEEPPETLPANLLLSSNDMSGREFATAMRQLGEPSESFAGEPMTQKFIEIVSNCEGVIAVVDLIRENEAEFRTHQFDAMKTALAEQVVPLIRGIELAISRRNLKKHLFPLFLVFTKKDLHGLERQELTAMVEKVFAIMLARLEEENLQLRVHTITNMGHGDSREWLSGAAEGMGFFIADLYFWTQHM